MSLRVSSQNLVSIAHGAIWDCGFGIADFKNTKRELNLELSFLVLKLDAFTPEYSLRSGFLEPYALSLVPS
jgi:hypothetical protein